MHYAHSRLAVGPQVQDSCGAENREYPSHTHACTHTHACKMDFSLNKMIAKIQWKARDFPYAAIPHIPNIPITISCTTVIHLLELTHLHWHIIITQSLSFTLGLTLGVTHSMGLGKCIMTYIRHYSIIQTSFAALKILSVLLHPSPQTLGNTDIFISSIVLPFPESQIPGLL
jgi:hypothetical protein